MGSPGGRYRSSARLPHRSAWLSDARIAQALRAIHATPTKQEGRIGEVGFAIDYESEAAFSRAYKAFFGRSPRDDHARPG